MTHKGVEGYQCPSRAGEGDLSLLVHRLSDEIGSVELECAPAVGARDWVIRFSVQEDDDGDLAGADPRRLSGTVCPVAVEDKKITLVISEELQFLQPRQSTAEILSNLRSD